MADCYEPVPLSAKLNKYKSNAYHNESKFKSAASDISQEVDSAIRPYEDAINTISSASSDAQAKTMAEGLTLIKQACSVMRDSMVNELDSICGQCDKVDGKLDEIDAKQKFVAGLTKSSWIESAWDDFGHFITGHWNNSHHGQAKKANQEIEQIDFI